jgi:uncharacterized membrane protein YjgN (DUF898 family)
MTAIDASAAAAPAVPAPAAPAVRFIGDVSAFWRLLIRGAMLLAITLGIYRFWFVTDVRRFLWSGTEISGETLEYTGTAYEILIGFLIAIAVLVPLNLMLFVVALGAGPIGQFAGVLTFPVLFFLGQFAVFRARRYRLTRTIYRGVRCHQNGSGLRYAVCASLWWIAIILTLGLAYPFAQSRLERFKMRHTYYGNLQGRFEGSGLRLFFRGLPMWLLVIGPLAFSAAYLIFGVEWSEVVAASAGTANPTEFFDMLRRAPGNLTTALGIGVIALGFSIIVALLLFPVFQAMVLRWWISGLRLGPLTVHSQLRTKSIYGAYLRFLGYGLVFSTLAGTFVGMVLFAMSQVLGALRLTAAADVVNAIVVIAAYVVVMLGYSAIYQGTVKLTLWRSGIDTMELDGVAALDGVRAEGAASSAVGEGLADALNVGGF